ncbi:Prefoldin subunit 6 [Vermiconidia calcicola]|uniref:Prefoldin subunit 6 n=1 Tax=Vermiconidia calcicola TaxID=1690605 RepID=A0ACC3NP70_9PEZI|nr:Prefoldin subunit 6 [Vermiconidia calcicola]
MADQKQLQSLSDEYEKFQGGITLVQARQKLESQFTENKGVQKEFSNLDDDAKIYRLTGPVLLKQDTTEAKSTVDSRLEYIEKEIQRVEGKIKALQQQCEGKRTEIMRLQSQAQQGTAATA